MNKDTPLTEALRDRDMEAKDGSEVNRILMDALDSHERLERDLSAAQERIKELEADVASEQRWAEQYAGRVGKLEMALEKISNTALSHPYAGVTCGEMARAALKGES